MKAIFGIIVIGMLITLTLFGLRAPNGREISDLMNNNVRGSVDQEIVARDLSVPWDIAFLPNGDMLVTERIGRLRQIGQQDISIDVPVAAAGEGGLLGLALHPDFEMNHFLYLYETHADQGGSNNRVVRYVYENGALADPFIVLSGIPGSSNHDGGRIAFGPDGLLYVTTGDAGRETTAQDIESLAGKILRINDDGSIPEDNPFGNAVYSYGHRNPQGIAWDREGGLWSTEHGRSGLQSGFDEINLIHAGQNYGWPVIEGDEVRDRLVSPIEHSGARDTWAPASLVYWGGSLWFGGLRGEALYEAKLNGTEVIEILPHLKEVYGRIRTVVLGPDNMLYITTSNTDGRGDPAIDDDRIIRIDPRTLRE